MANKIDKDVLAKLEAEHGGEENIYHLKGRRGEEAVFKMPSQEAFDRFLFEQSKPASRATAIRSLLVGTCVYPEREVFKEMLAKRPGLSDSFGAKVLEWAGMEEAEVVKK